MTDTENLIARARHMAALHPNSMWSVTMGELCDHLAWHYDADHEYQTADQLIAPVGIASETA